MTVPEQLTAYLKGTAPAQVSSGELQRLIWKNENGTMATPRSIVRRLQELVNDGVLVVEHKKKHAWYSWGNPAPKPKPVAYVRHPLTGERITTEELARL